ncbi:MAG: DUF167 domain-containing protein [Candidatus Limnocylindria bacterium]
MPRVELRVRVTPRAEVDRAGPYAAEVLHVRVTRPPADGEANRAVSAVVARALGVSRSAVTLVAGTRSRDKRFAIDGLSRADVAARLRALGD